MRKIICTSITAVVVAALIVLSFVFGRQTLDETQLRTLKILGIICGSAALYCFIVGEISRNNSQMDKLWSILPIAYAWVTAGIGGMSPRLIVMALLVTAWGIRLTINFGRKGAYSIKFWAGEEDYRWVMLRKTKYFKNKFVWALFDLFFISIYQNALVLAICLPMVAVQTSSAPFGAWDIVATVAVVGFLAIETIADEQQNKFQTEKHRQLKEGKKLEELELPYRRGFNHVGLWSRSAHPNYFGEQSVWVSMFIFTLGAGIGGYGFFNWSMIGCLVLVLLFLGSSELGEKISGSKYPGYKDYLTQVTRFIPILKYKPKD